jgi:phosphoenolpyruvate synthase/pyruvate phosphate dikinase
MADQIAETAKVFSFGANDLTQMTFGFRRDDAGKFLPYHLSKKILLAESFQTLDQDGVGQLVDMGIRRGRATRPDLKVGICGELAVVFPCGSIVGTGGVDFVVEVAEVVGSVIAPYRGCPFDGH